MDLSFSHRKSERSVNNISLSPQTQAVLRLGINRLTRFQAGEGLGQWTVDAGISRGMPWLDTNRDPADLPREAARYRFTKLERSEEHTSELQSPCNLVCRLLLEKKNREHKPR